MKVSLRCADPIDGMREGISTTSVAGRIGTPMNDAVSPSTVRSTCELARRPLGREHGAAASSRAPTFGRAKLRAQLARSLAVHFPLERALVQGKQRRVHSARLHESVAYT